MVRYLGTNTTKVDSHSCIAPACHTSKTSVLFGFINSTNALKIWKKLKYTLYMFFHIYTLYVFKSNFSSDFSENFVHNYCAIFPVSIANSGHSSKHEINTEANL